MTQEDVIVLWKDANNWDVRGYKSTLEDLERFAKLVAKHTLSNIDPPQRTWVGLTPQQRDEINERVYGAVPHHVVFHHAIEAKLKELNS